MSGVPFVVPGGQCKLIPGQCKLVPGQQKMYGSDSAGQSLLIVIIMNGCTFLISCLRV